MKNKNMVTVILQDYQIEYMEALCMRLRVSPHILIGELINFAGLIGFPDTARHMIRGRDDRFWSDLVDE